MRKLIFCVAMNGMRANIWDIETTTLLGFIPELRAPMNEATSITFNQDGTWLFYDREDSPNIVDDTVNIWTESHETITLYTKDSASGYYPIAVNRDDTLIAFYSNDFQNGAFYNGDVISLFDLTTNEYLGRLPSGRWPCALGFDLTGTVLAVGVDDGAITLWNVEEALEQLAIGEPPVYTESGEVVPNGVAEKEAFLQNLMDTASVDLYPPDWSFERVDFLAFSPDGTLLASVQAGQLQLWGVPTE
jgi:WD40 repeat protein